jgi:hypothetical protein
MIETVPPPCPERALGLLLLRFNPSISRYVVE